jgi:hypothetical protein
MMSVEKIVQHISEQVRRERALGLHAVNESAAHGDLHLHTHEDDEYHVIKGVPHTKENAEKAYNQVHAAVVKKTGDSAENVHDSMSAPGHHELIPAHKIASKGKPTMVHKDMASYVKHHAKRDAEFHKTTQED